MLTIRQHVRNFSGKKIGGARLERRTGGNYAPPQPGLPKTWDYFWGDVVQVKAGTRETIPDEGKQETIKFVQRKTGKVLLPGLNIQEDKLHKASAIRAPRAITRAQPYEHDEVELVNPETNKPCTEGIEWRRLTIDGYTNIIRVDKELGTVIPVPFPDFNKRPKRFGKNTTMLSEARRITYEKHPLFKAQQEAIAKATNHVKHPDLAKKVYARMFAKEKVAERKKLIQYKVEAREAFYTKANDTLKQLYKEKYESESSIP